MFAKLFAFLRTKIGLSLVIALICIIGALIIKLSADTSASAIKNTVGLIAETSVKNGIQNGDITPSNWEDALKLVGPSGGAGEPLTLAGIAAASSSTEENLTATDRFSREFFTKYMELKKSGATIDENTSANIINDLLANDYGNSGGEKVYTNADIKISADTSADAIRKYANSLGAIIDTPFPAGYEQELIVVARVNDTGNTAELSSLSANAARYKAIRDKIASLSVPSSLKSPHLSLINSISAMLEGVRGMLMIDTDPVSATRMIMRYEDGLRSISLPLEIIKAYLIKQNITFSSGESGNTLVQ